MKLCVIPARGGSKRIPRKNIRDFCGKPMIAWSIEAARESNLFDLIIVSTDDEDIAQIAQACGAIIPFLRPSYLSDDFTPTRPVVNHAIQEIKKKHGEYEHTCVIYPTAPLIQVADLKTGLETLIRSQADFAFSVTNYPYPIQRALKITLAGRVEMLQPEHFNARSQDLESAYHDAGQFYWGKTEAFLANKNTFSSFSVPIILPSWRVVDIDTENDWIRAEKICRSIIHTNNDPAPE
jgi:pseudaminic acid cytidylyltransferase